MQKSHANVSSHFGATKMLREPRNITVFHFIAPLSHFCGKRTHTQHTPHTAPDADCASISLIYLPSLQRDLPTIAIEFVNLNFFRQNLTIHMTHATTCSNPTVFQIIIFSITCLLIYPGCFAQDEVPGVPPTKWFITNPSFDQSRLDLFLTYQVSDYIPYENLRWYLYDGLECREGADDITENDYLTAELMGPDDGNTVGEGNSFREFKMALSFDPESIRGSPILHETGQKIQLKFCVRLSAFSANALNPAAVEISYKQTTMTVDILQEGETGVDEFVLDAGEIVDETTEQLYTLEGWLCNETNHRIYDPLPIYQGRLTRVCVTPNAEAQADGVYMRAIDSFYWTRDTIFQTAINPRQNAAPLTEIECVPGMLICAFTTILRAGFFFKRGRVGGAGIGWLQVRQCDTKSRDVFRSRYLKNGVLLYASSDAGTILVTQDALKL
jgi:hypothetical protein